MPDIVVLDTGFGRCRGLRAGEWCGCTAYAKGPMDGFWETCAREGCKHARETHTRTKK